MDEDVAASLHAGAVVDVAIASHQVTALHHLESALEHDEISSRLDALATSAANGHIDSAILESHLAGVLLFFHNHVVVVGLLAHLDAVVGNVLNGHLTAILQVVLVDVEAIALRAQDVDLAHGLLNLDILLAPEGMARVTRDVEDTRALELGVTLHGEAALLRAASAVGEVAGSSLHQFHCDALAVANVDGSAVGVVKSDAVETHCNLEATVLIERAIGRRARESVGNLVGHISVLQSHHMSAVDAGGHVLGNITSHNHLSGVAVVGHIHSVVGHRSVVDINLVDVGNIERLALGSERCAASVANGVELSGGERPLHVAGNHPHRLVALGNLSHGSSAA